MSDRLLLRQCKALASETPFATRHAFLRPFLPSPIPKDGDGGYELGMARFCQAEQ
jgi:hypothetical protein